MNDTRVHAIILAHQKTGDFWASAHTTLLRSSIGNFNQQQSLLEATIERISCLIPHQRRWIATTIEQEAVVVEKLGSLIAGVLIEPEEQGGVASMLFSALLIHESDPEAVLLFLPSTHQIVQPEKFLAFIDHALDFVSTSDCITMVGVQPLYVTRDYNYLSYEIGNGLPGKFKKIYRSSDEGHLTHILRDKNCVWDTGIVLAKADVFIKAVEKVAPEVYASVHEYVQGLGEYREVPAIPFSNIVEQIENIKIFPIDCIWQDVAAITASVTTGLESQIGQTDNYIEIDSHNNLIEAEGHLVALVGVENLCVIKKDDIVLVVHRDHIQKVKQVIDELKKGREKYV